MTAAGPFDVKLTPQPPGEDAVLGRFTLDKAFHGDLDATSKGQMLDVTGGKHAYVLEYTFAGGLQR